MSILADHQIVELCLSKEMISPFVQNQVKVIGDKKIISYGVSSYGYDIRCANEFKLFTNAFNTLADPKELHAESLISFTNEEYFIIPPNSFALARSVEYFKIPRNIMVVCVGKSTYARIGLIVNVTPLEPEWEGHVTLEFSNTTNLPSKVYVNEGIAQMLFFRGDSECLKSYKDRLGKYQGQTGITLPKV